MATKSRIELGTQALADLGVIQSGQTPEPEDAATIDGYIDDVLDRLTQEIVAVTDPDKIPSVLFKHIAILVADDAATEFGKPQSPQIVQLAENKLRVLARAKPTGEPLEVDYF